MSEHKKQTSINFTYMKSCHYPRALYRDTEFKEGEWQPGLVVTKSEHPKLFNHMRVFDTIDLKIENVFMVHLSTPYDSIPDSWNIVYYTGSRENRENCETLFAGSIDLSGMKPREVVETIITNITEAQKEPA